MSGNGTTNIMGKPEAEAVAQIVEKHLEPRLIQVERGDTGKAAVLVMSEGLQAYSIKEHLDEYLDRPERRRGAAVLGDLDSFIAHANRFSDTDSAIFASPDPQHPKLVSVLNYHRVGSEADPRFTDHRGVYDFPLSEEWKRWTEKSKAAMSQRDFAEFIESNIMDVYDPAAADDGPKAFATKLGVEFASPQRLMDLSKGLAIRVASKVANAINIGSGETQLVYSTEHQDEKGAPLKVPGAFLLALRVFRNGGMYQVPARLRYREKDGSVTWSFELWRTDKVFEAAFKKACDHAAAETKLPLFVGSPEA